MTSGGRDYQIANQLNQPINQYVNQDDATVTMPRASVDGAPNPNRNGAVGSGESLSENVRQIDGSEASTSRVVLCLKKVKSAETVYDFWRCIICIAQI